MLNELTESTNDVVRREEDVIHHEIQVSDDAPLTTCGSETNVC